MFRRHESVEPELASPTFSAPGASSLIRFRGKKLAVDIQSIGLENFMDARHHLSRFLELTRQSQAVNGKRKHYIRPPAQNQ
jgi:hypothetical protein